MKRVLLAAFAATGLGAQPALADPLQSVTFQTEIPAGWGHTDFKYSGITAYTLTSPGTQMASLHHNIPAPGGIAIEISTRTVANLQHVLHKKLPKKSGKGLLQ